jgi:hypothetical protein
MQQILQQHVSQVASGSSTARTEGLHSPPFHEAWRLSCPPRTFVLSARSPSAPKSNRPAFLDAYFKYRKFNVGKPRLDIDGAERDAARWYTTFHNITLDQLQQANDYWYPPEQEVAAQPPMQLHTPSPSSSSPSPEAPAVHPHIKPDPSEAEDQDMDEGVDVQDTRLQTFLEPVMLNQTYHLPPSASIQELFCTLHSDSIASFIDVL